MTRRYRNLSRRTVLRGLGASMALPWLDAMLPRRAMATSTDGLTESGAPVRLAILYMPNGVLVPAWKPEGEEENFQLSPTLEPLANVKDQCMVLTNLRNTAGLRGDGHYAKTSSWLTGKTAVRTGGKDLRAGISFDQVIAHHVGEHTPLPSLELGIDPVHTVVDMGYSTVYGCHISWKTDTLPAPKEINPQAAFDRLFRSSDPSRQADTQSVLDLVMDDARGLRRAVGGADRLRLDEYLDSVRAVETRLEKVAGRSLSDQQLASRADILPRPEQDPADFAEHVRLMLDIMALAFWADSTRVTSFMFGNDVSGRDFSFVDGVKGGFHPLSHHEGDAEKQDGYQRINRWHVAQVAYFLERLRSISEHEHNLLDQSVVMFGSSISDGNAHSPFEVPTLLAGGGGGRLKTGRHVVCPKRTPLTNVYNTLYDVFGIQTEPDYLFGDSEGDLDQLLLV